MLARNSLFQLSTKPLQDHVYTAITRGKKLVILVGQKKAVAIAIRNNTAGKRWSLLQEWLQSGFKTDGHASFQPLKEGGRHPQSIKNKGLE